MATLKINGTQYTLDVEPEMPLLWALRDELGLTGTKFGCGVASCGACTVQVNGNPVRSCVMPVAAVGSGNHHHRRVCRIVTGTLRTGI